MLKYSFEGILFDLILYILVNIFSLMLDWVFLGWTSTKQGLMCLAQGHNVVGLEPAFKGFEFTYTKGSNEEVTQNGYSEKINCNHIITLMKV